MGSAVLFRVAKFTLTPIFRIQDEIEIAASQVGEKQNAANQSNGSGVYEAEILRQLLAQ